jgi:hypothetical protein
VNPVLRRGPYERTLVTSIEGVRINAVLEMQGKNVKTARMRVGIYKIWVITPFKCAVGSIDGVQPVVEPGSCKPIGKIEIAVFDSEMQTFDEIASLEQKHGRGINKRHRVFEIEIALAVESERLIRVLDNAYTHSQEWDQKTGSRHPPPSIETSLGSLCC